MKVGVSRWTFQLDDVAAAVREFSPTRWMAAGLCVAIGLGAAVAIDRTMTPPSEPARLVTMEPSGSATSAAPAEVLDAAKRQVSSPQLLKQLVSHLDLSGTGLFGQGTPEEAMKRAIDVSASDSPHILRLSADTGDEALDIVVANAAANALARMSADTSAADAGLKFVVVAKAAKGAVAPMSRIYQGEAIALGLLSALAILAAGLGRALRNRAIPVEIPVRKPAVVQRGILEQIDMLERMWPETGRTAAMPEASNDEPEQTSLMPARQIVLRMGELRQEAQKAIEEPSEEAMENVLFDIQSLRDRILWIAGEQIRNRRFTSSSR